MIRSWIGIALLSVSWLLGLDYFQQRNPAAWAIVLAAGVAMIWWGTRQDESAMGRIGESAKTNLLTLALLLPALWIMPWPYRLAPLLLVAGLVMSLAPATLPWLRRLASAALLSGVVLLAQAVTLFFYESLTARSHDLPDFLAQIMSWLASALDIDAAASGPTLALNSMRKVHPFGATWELLLDPAFACFLAGGLIYIALNLRIQRVSSQRGGQADRSSTGVSPVPPKEGTGETPVLQIGHPTVLRTAPTPHPRPTLRRWLNASACFLLAMLLWIPLRLALLLGLYLHRVLITDYDAPLEVMNQFYSPWIHLLLLSGAILLAWKLVHPAKAPKDQPPVPIPHFPISPFSLATPLLLITLGIALLTAAIFYDPVGQRKPGRVLVDEYHSKWEPTQRAMDTTWYGHLSGYNYWCIYEYCSRFYDMGRLTTPIDDKALAGVDVLMLKCPTTRYTPAEVDCLRRFVERGGGLMLVGEHTNVFATGTHLNDIARHFGFSFRSDCLFGIDSVFEELYEPPLVPHPIIQRMPPMDFAVSCSIDPGNSAGRAAIRGIGVKNAPADYHASNFYPQIEDRPESRYGAFVQLWTTRQGLGRVVAFTDSTIWSNFSAMEPGKPQLLLGILEWLNHRNTTPDLWPGLMIAGAGLTVFALLRVGWHGLLASRVVSDRKGTGCKQPLPPGEISWLPLLAAGMFGWSIAVVAVRAAHDRAMPAPKNHSPLVQVVIDQTVSQVILPKNGFIAGKPDGFGIFERWILRVGYFTSRRTGREVFDGNLVVYLHPSQSVDRAYRAALKQYVENGGHVLILDSALNRHSTANSLLWEFGAAVDRSTSLQGELIAPGFPTVPAAAALEVSGGIPFATINDKPVGTRLHYGKGTVTIVGFAARFNDDNMGITGDTVPDEKMRQVYEVEYRLLRWIIQGPPATQPSTTQPLQVEGQPDEQ